MAAWFIVAECSAPSPEQKSEALKVSKVRMRIIWRSAGPRKHDSVSRSVLSDNRISSFVHNFDVTESSFVESGFIAFTAPDRAKVLI